MEESYLNELAIDMYCEGKHPIDIAAELGYQHRDIRRICKTYAEKASRERHSWLKKYGWNWQFAK